MCRRDGTFELCVYHHSPALALMEDIPYKEHAFQLNPGDSLFVYTDGIAEAADTKKELIGSDRMLKALNKKPHGPLKEILGNVAADIKSFAGDAEQFDDITMMCLRYLGPNKKDVTADAAG
ncbi:MAG: serine/threonine-protein phosphatase [Lachnospiraceae bacterium]|nr:serine/threonine-protein phosphatase [Oscillospiraceae bacterium]MBR3310111.1 serine/threonine-protein phosphatase [Lachnospiraceae bacterium]